MARSSNTTHRSITDARYDRLFLVRPRRPAGDKSSPRGDAGSSELVGVLVRGTPETEHGRSGLSRQSYEQLSADLEHWIATVPMIATEITDRPDDVGGAALPPQLRMVNDWLVGIRNQLAHQPGAIDLDAELRAVRELARFNTNAGDDAEQPSGEVSLAVLDTLIETTQTQLMLLRHIRESSATSRRERVTLQTPTGALEYTLPFSRDDTYSSAAVSKILSPTGKGHRSIAQHRRRANELLGLKIGNQYRYPKFQIDPVRHEIRPIVAYANRRMESDADPWGTLDWWYSEDETLGRRRPVELLDSGELTQDSVDLAIRRSQQGMD